MVKMVNFVMYILPKNFKMRLLKKTKFVFFDQIIPFTEIKV